MSDLISRAWLLDVVENLIPWDTEKDRNRAIHHVRELAPASRWIPCSERLPENIRKEYWVCTDTEYQCECRWTNNRFGMGESDKWGWNIFDTPQYSEVVAWMPLPEPYKEEEDG